MTENNGAQWYAVQSHPREEQKALEHLRRQNYLAYLPRYAAKVSHARKSTRVFRPFFPRYLFVSLDLASQGWRAIRSTMGVSNIVCFGDRPSALPPGVVEGLQHREDAEGCISFARQNLFRPGMPLMVRSGPFSNLFGLCERMTDNERVAILLDLLGRKVRVLLDVDTVEAA